ncbi:Uncharacterised protein [Pediococcus pentosaceus]|nr:Uncharacterised protein [Pediococcus pentosaceus]
MAQSINTKADLVIDATSFLGWVITENYDWRSRF